MRRCPLGTLAPAVVPAAGFADAVPLAFAFPCALPLPLGVAVAVAEQGDEPVRAAHREASGAQPAAGRAPVVVADLRPPQLEFT
ncbi:hypothetical protein G3I31_23455, partial [Streptomyces sp. SID9913]|uniref:hypothetical protein n=1 Tax=Streptomyces sp. SID9913 TaxID=2706117 RepID=UPI0013DCD2BD